MKSEEHKASYIALNGKFYRAINNCPVCKGSVFAYRGYPQYKNMSALFQCLHCARIYKKTLDGFELWVKTIMPGVGDYGNESKNKKVNLQKP